MKNYYEQLGVEIHANQETITTAYTQQRERYAPHYVATMDEDMRQLANDTLSVLEKAYQVLSDPQQRHAYDISLNIASPKPTTSTGTISPSRTQRDLWFLVGGALVGLLVVILVWQVTSNRTTATPASPEVNRQAPLFALDGLTGDTIRLEDYRGNIVMVNFWGSWCEPCIHELPELQAAYENLKDEGFVIIGINLFDDEQAQNHSLEDIQQFIAQRGIHYPIALDTDGNTTNAYHVFPIPTSFFINAEGHIRYVLPRELTAKEIEERFVALKNEASTVSQ